MPPYIRCDFDIGGEADLDGVGIPLPPRERPATKVGSNKLKDRQKGSGPNVVVRGNQPGSSRDGTLGAPVLTYATNRAQRIQMIENPISARTENWLFTKRRIRDSEEEYSLTFDRTSVVVLVDDMASMNVGENRAMVGGRAHNPHHRTI